jgi:tryptophan synthase alpha chain
LVVPDLPLEEADNVLNLASEVGLELTLLVAPTSPKERIMAIAERSQGFIYLVSTTGVTGMRTQLEERVQELLLDLRQVTDKPIGVGFGISQPEHARQVMEWGADAAIVGSAFVKRLTEGTSPESTVLTGVATQGIAAISSFCHSLKASLVED